MRKTMNHIMAMVNDIEAEIKEAILKEAEEELPMWYNTYPMNLYWDIAKEKYDDDIKYQVWLETSSDDDKYDMRVLTELIARVQSQLNDLSIPDRLELTRCVKMFIWDSMANPSEADVQKKREELIERYRS